MNLEGHHDAGRYLFWIAQIIGVAASVALIIFVIGNLLTELITRAIDVREDYSIILIAVCEILVGISFIISWKRKRLGPILVLIFTVVIFFLWGPQSYSFIWMHSPLVVSGLLLLFYSFYKEWILKRKP